MWQVLHVTPQYIEVDIREIELKTKTLRKKRTQTVLLLLLLFRLVEN